MTLYLSFPTEKSPFLAKIVRVNNKLTISSNCSECNLYNSCNNFRGNYYHCPHFKDEETGVQKRLLGKVLITFRHFLQRLHPQKLSVHWCPFSYLLLCIRKAMAFPFSNLKILRKIFTELGYHPWNYGQDVRVCRNVAAPLLTTWLK